MTHKKADADGASLVLENSVPGPIFFLHIPKTAGTSVFEVFSRTFRSDRVLRLTGESEDLYAGANHQEWSARLAGYDLVAGHVPAFILDALKLRFRFVTFLRHPVDRVKSLYHFWRASPPVTTAAEKYRTQIAQSVTLAEFAATRHPYLMASVNNGMCRMLSGLPDAENAKLTDSELFELAARSLRRMCFGVCEEMVASLHVISEELRILPVYDTIRLNAGQVRSTAGLSLSEYEAVQDVNIADIMLYRYARAELDVRLKRLRYKTLAASAESLPAFKRDDSTGAWSWLASDPLCGEGFHELEFHANITPYRFTGPKLISTLYFQKPAGAKWSKLFITILFAPDPINIESIEFLVNDSILHATRQFVPEEGMVYSGEIETNALVESPVLSISIRTTIVSKPSSLNAASRDHRQLGVALSKISII